MLTVYTEYKNYAAHLAFDISSSTTYHTVTTAEAVANCVILTVASLYTMVSWNATGLKWISTLIGALNTGAIWYSAPNLATEQYIKIHTYYSNGREYAEISIWHNYLAYCNDPTNPMYNNTSSVAIIGY